MTPLVSIIMPCLNGRAYLGQAIASVLAQTFQQWELLIIDDGSTDGSAELSDDTARQDGRIVPIRTSGRTGTARARNTGIALARGRYVAFLDCDDWWHADKLTLQLQAIGADGAAFCCSPYLVCDEVGRPLRQQTLALPLTAKRYLHKHVVIGCLTVMVDTERLGPFLFREHLPIAEDFLLWYELLLRAEQHQLHAVSTAQSLAFYRVHTGGKSRSKLRQAKAHWQIFTRELGLSAPAALHSMVWYLVNGLRDRLGKQADAGAAAR